MTETLPESTTDGRSCSGICKSPHVPHSQTSLMDLPDEVIQEIFLAVVDSDPSSILVLRLVCKRFQLLSQYHPLHNGLASAQVGFDAIYHANLLLEPGRQGPAGLVDALESCPPMPVQEVPSLTIRKEAVRQRKGRKKEEEGFTLPALPLHAKRPKLQRLLAGNQDSLSESRPSTSPAKVPTRRRGSFMDPTFSSGQRFIVAEDQSTSSANGQKKAISRSKKPHVSNTVQCPPGLGGDFVDQNMQPNNLNAAKNPITFGYYSKGDAGSVRKFIREKNGKTQSKKPSSSVEVPNVMRHFPKVPIELTTMNRRGALLTAELLQRPTTEGGVAARRAAREARRSISEGMAINPKRLRPSAAPPRTLSGSMPTEPEEGRQMSRSERISMMKSGRRNRRRHSEPAGQSLLDNDSSGSSDAEEHPSAESVVEGMRELFSGGGPPRSAGPTMARRRRHVVVLPDETAPRAPSSVANTRPITVPDRGSRPEWSTSPVSQSDFIVERPAVMSGNSRRRSRPRSRAASRQGRDSDENPPASRRSIATVPRQMENGVQDEAESGDVGDFPSDNPQSEGKENKRKNNRVDPSESRRERMFVQRALQLGGGGNVKGNPMQQIMAVKRAICQAEIQERLDRLMTSNNAFRFAINNV